MRTHFTRSKHLALCCLGILIAVGSTLLLCLTVATQTTFRTRSGVALKQGTEVRFPVKVKQLPAEGGGVPVELLCGSASVMTPNILNGFLCDLKNNTGKDIVGASIVYSVLLEEQGQEVKDTRSHTLVTSLDPDFYEKTKSVPTGGSITVRPAGSLTYENSTVKGVEAYVDYVEFSDNTYLGPNENGAAVIKDFRAGASKYKKWLAEKYRQDSINRVVELLGNDQPLPQAVFGNAQQELGAKYYRRRLRKMYETRGRAEVQKHLSK